MPSLPKHLLPFPSSFAFALPDRSADVSVTGAAIDAAMAALDLRWRYRAARAEGVGFAAGNVWGRAARRRREGKAKGAVDGARVGDGMDEDSEDEEEEPALGVRIRVRERELQDSDEAGGMAGGKNGGLEVDVRWLVGRDHVLFESFCGWLKRVVAHE